MDTGVATVIRAIEGILNQVPKEKTFVRMTPIIYGKTIQRIPIKSKNTLTGREMIQYRNEFINAYKCWERLSNNEWIATEIGGLQFTVKFIRKGTPEAERYLEKLKNQGTEK